MDIKINDDRKIEDIQKDFSGMFPFLKLEFFVRPHKVGGGSPGSQMLRSSKTIGECRKVHKKGHLIIIPDMKVLDLEQQFQDTYGLSAQVFRRVGKVWLETTVTDTWTLAQQNEHGKMLSTHGQTM